jgi:hypothetical protein
MLCATTILAASTLEVKAFGKIFRTEIECMREVGRQAAKCLHWFDVANTQLRRHGARYSTRKSCEAIHRICRLSSLADRQLTQSPFEPELLGIRIITSSRGTPTVSPIIGGLAAEPAGITTNRLDSSRLRRRQPNIDSQESQGPTVQARDNSVIVSEPDLSGPVMTYPVPRHRLPTRFVE